MKNHVGCRQGCGMIVARLVDNLKNQRWTGVFIEHAGRLAALLGRSSSVDQETSAAPASADSDKQRGSSP
jgi:hypothetical protein